MPRTAKVEDQNIIRVVTTTTLTDKEISNLLFFFGVQSTQKLKEIIVNEMQSKLTELTISSSIVVDEMRDNMMKPKRVDLSKPTDKKEEKAA
jgi:hypothetical protein